MNIELKIDQDTNLKLVNRQNAPEFLELINHNRSYLREWLGWLDVTNTVEDLHRFIDSCVSEFSARNGLSAWIWHRQKIIGIVHLKEVDHANRRAMIDFAINDWNLNRVEIRCATGNLASQAIPKSLGFRA